jgi:hypothetical protein
MDLNIFYVILFTMILFNSCYISIFLASKLFTLFVLLSFDVF